MLHLCSGSILYAAAEDACGTLPAPLPVPRGAGMVHGGSWMSPSALGALEEPRRVLSARLCCSH